MKLIKECRYALIPFSFFYFLIISIRNIFYRLHIFRVHTLGAMVISVGNITWGGTGKTPAAVFIAHSLLKRGRKPSILIRGYGNDEKDLLSSLVPGAVVAAGKDRVKNGIDVIASRSVDTILLDDGFQYRRLKRDLDIVTIDAVNPFGSGWVIPAGSMREGFSALKRADIFLITKVDLIENQMRLQMLEARLKKINPRALIVKSIHRARHFYKLSGGERVDKECLKNKNLALLSAIGSPYSFERIISGLGLKFAKHFVFRDHYWYRKRDLEKIASFCRKNAIDTVITTEKDAVRLKAVSAQLSAANFLVLSIKLKIIENEEHFFDRLFRIYNS